MTDTDNIFDIQEYGLDYCNRELWLTPEPSLSYGHGEEATETGVEWQMATKFLKNLQILQSSSQYNEPILIHMKTCGGIWEEGIAIYDAIKACPCPVTILSYTHARSMSSIIFQAADKRVMMPHSCFMFHLGETHIGGTDKQVDTFLEWSKVCRGQMMDIYTHVMLRDGCWENSKDAAKWLNEEMDRKEDVFLSPKDAIKHGFADEVFDGDWDALTDYTDEQLDRWS